MEVTAFARSADFIKLKSDKLSVVIGQTTIYEDVKKAIVGCDVVISCIRRPGSKPSITITDITNNIVNSMNETGMKRIAQVASAGVHGELK